MAAKAKTILICEDEKPLAKALELKLKHAGFDVILAFDGEIGFSTIQKGGVDFVILDLMMPKKDGFWVLEQVRENKIKTPIIVTSNLGQEEDVKRAKDLGAVDYFVKANIPISEVVTIVKKHLGL